MDFQKKKKKNSFVDQIYFFSFLVVNEAYVSNTQFTQNYKKKKKLSFADKN